ncbi:MAG: transketolase [Armatimonadetes bacterium]|nr:transketolase [Armatimonadota bacterium]
MSLDRLCTNTIRTLSIDAIQKANSGHPGLPMGAAPMAYTLWTRHLKHNPRDPQWPDRDRFVLSGGHGSMLLYSLLHLTGYDLSLEELKSFRQWGSKTPGHPEHGVAPGVETTTGPLGQGFATAVGMALAEAHLAARFNRPGHAVVDHHTYVLASDGDLMEGVAAEAASLAGHLGLGKLIVLYDSNDISLDGGIQLSFSEDVARRFEAYRWHVVTVRDGNDVAAIDAAIRAARAETSRPSLLVIHTCIGYGSPARQGKSAAHGAPLGKEEVAATKRNLDWPEEGEFTVPEPALAHFRRAVERGERAQAEWQQRFAAWAANHPALAREWREAFSGRLPEGWDAEIPTFPASEPLATRAAGSKVLNAIAKCYPGLIGGSADLNASTATSLKGMGDFESPGSAGGDVDGASGGVWGPTGRNIRFGVREHAMTAAANGIALHGGLRPFVATFFTFADYLKPALRLSALMEQPVVFVFTHDSIALGEDGPTHQPVEQLAMLRAVPNLVALRPADANETAEAWRVAAERLDGPTALVLTRQNTPTLDRSVYPSAEGLRRGAYVLKEAEGGAPQIVLIGSGSEVEPVLAAQAILAERGVRVRVVSMPSWELFEAQPAEYRASVLPAGVKKLAVEALVSLGWHRYVGGDGDVIALDRFGASAPAKVLLREFGFTPENIADRALKLLGAD